MEPAAAPAFKVIRDLRDRLEDRICRSEDFRALMALNREIAAFEDEGRRQSAALPTAVEPASEPAPAAPPAPGPPLDLDLDSWVQEPKRWWRRRA